MNPTLPDVFRRAIAKGRHLAPNGEALSMERITRIFNDGRVQVSGRWGTALIPVAGEGLRALRPGMMVAVAWEKGRPVVVIAHSARRSGAAPPLPQPGAGIVEYLFIVTDPATGLKQIGFRNFGQITNLEIRAQLPGDPVAVRWGADTRSFVVRVGGPLGGIDFTGEVDNPPQDQTFHVFEFVGGEAGVVLGFEDLAVKLLASYTPSTSALEVMAYTAEFAGSSFSRHLKRELMATEIDPPPIGLIDPMPQCVVSAFSVTDFADTSLQQSGSVDRRAVTLGELLLNQALESFETPFGPSEIVDFGLDADRHLLLAVRARKHVEVLVPTTIVGEVQTAVGAACGWDAEGQPPGSQGVAVRDGEAHAWVIDLTVGAIRFRTNQVEAALKLQLGTGSADVVGIEGLAETLADPSGCSPGVCVETTHALEIPPDNPDPARFYPTGAALAYGTLPAPSIDPRDWRDLWDEARFAFITGSLARTGSVVPVAKEAAIYIGQSILGYAEPYNPFLVESQLITWTAPTPSMPDLPPVYHVTDLQILSTPMTATHPLLLFVGVLRRKNNAAHEYSAHIVKADGTIVRTLKDWTAMEAGDVMSEIDQAEFHDGGRAALLSGNFEHVLWEYSTAAERAAQPFELRHVMLTQLSTGQTKAVGTNWSEFRSRGFTILNLDVMYETQEDEGRRFTDAWALPGPPGQPGGLAVGTPTLDQAAKDYPPEDSELAPCKELLDPRPGDPPAFGAGDAQAINDPEALAPTGRELQPEVV